MIFYDAAEALRRVQTDSEGRQLNDREKALLEYAATLLRRNIDCADELLTSNRFLRGRVSRLEELLELSQQRLRGLCMHAELLCDEDRSVKLLNQGKKDIAAYAQGTLELIAEISRVSESNWKSKSMPATPDGIPFDGAE